MIKDAHLFIHSLMICKTNEQLFYQVAIAILDQECSEFESNKIFSHLAWI